MNNQPLNSPKTLPPLILAAALGSVAPSLASATSININPSKDNTLYEFVAADGDRSNALGINLFAGMTAEGFIRRGVLAFDIAGSIPPGSTITSASLTLNMSRTISDARIVELHKLLADWGKERPTQMHRKVKEHLPPPTMPHGGTVFTTLFFGRRKAETFPGR